MWDSNVSLQAGWHASVHATPCSWGNESICLEIALSDWALTLLLCMWNMSGVSGVVRGRGVHLSFIGRSDTYLDTLRYDTMQGRYIIIWSDPMWFDEAWFNPIDTVNISLMLKQMYIFQPFRLLRKYHFSDLSTFYALNECILYMLYTCCIVLFWIWTDGCSLHKRHWDVSANIHKHTHGSAHFLKLYFLDPYGNGMKWVDNAVLISG